MNIIIKLISLFLCLSSVTQAQKNDVAIWTICKREIIPLKGGKINDTPFTGFVSMNFTTHTAMITGSNSFVQKWHMSDLLDSVKYQKDDTVYTFAWNIKGGPYRYVVFHSMNPYHQVYKEYRYPALLRIVTKNEYTDYYLKGGITFDRDPVRE